MRLMAIAVALGMLVPATAMARVLYECRMMGTIGTSCCCKSQQAADHDTSTSVERADCCDATILSSDRHPASPSSSEIVDIPSAAVIASLPEHYTNGRAVGSSVCEPNRARGPPIGPPLYIQHCALLN